MKKIISGLIAVVFAIGAFAFTYKDKEANFANPYWFKTQADGTVINSNGVPPQQASDPFGCTSGTNGCSKSYTSYTLVSPGVYGPAGTLQNTDMKP